MNAEMTENESEARYIGADQIRIEKTDGGFLSMTLDGTRYERIHLYRSFPLSAEDEFVSVRDDDGTEIGILRTLDDLDRRTLQLITDELDSRYFTPSIRKIISLKEEFGYTYWEVDTDAGPCRFTAQVGKNAARRLEDGSLVIADVDNNRFELPDYLELEAKHLRIVENLL